MAIFDKTCGNVSLTVSDCADHWGTITTKNGELRGLKPEDLRDLRHLIDRGLAAAKSK